MGHEKTNRRGARAAFALAISTALLLAALAPAAQASKSVEGFLGKATGSGTIGGQFNVQNGVAVNLTGNGGVPAGSIYVADGNSRIEQFSAAGSFVRAFGQGVVIGGRPNNAGINEVQTLTVSATGGTFTLKYSGQETSALPYNASAAEVQSAIDLLKGIAFEGGSVSVTGGPGDELGTTPYVITFNGGGNEDKDVAQPTSVSTALTGGAHTATVVTTTNGFSGYEICDTTAGNVAADCKEGVNSEIASVKPALGGELFEPQGIAIDQETGDVYVTDRTFARVDEYDATGHFIRAWGADVIPAGAEGTGTLTEGSATVSSVATAKRAFAKGQAIEATGIPANTTIAAVGAGTITLSQVATASGAGTTLTAPTGAGNVALNERQSVTVAATGGTFTLTFTTPNPSNTTATTAAVNWNASAAEVQAALEGLSNIGAGNVAVSGGPGDELGTSPYLVEFKGARFADTNVEQMSANSTALTGGAHTATPATLREGSSAFEVCAVAAECKVGVSASGAGAFGQTGAEPFRGQPAVAPTGSPNAGDVLVADPANRRVQEFSSAGAFVRAFGFDVDATEPGTGFEVCTASSGDTCKIGAEGAGSGQFGLNGPLRVAEDSAGDIYTVESAANFRVQKFTLPSNVPTPEGAFDAADLGGSSTGTTPTDVQIGASGNVFVIKAFAAGATPSCPYTGAPSVAEERRVVEVSSAGSLLDTHMACAGIASARGLGLNASSGKIYVSSTFGGNSRVYILDNVTPPSATFSGVTENNGTEATFNGEVNPHSSATQLGTECRFDYTDKASWEASGFSGATHAPCASNPGTGTSAVPVSAHVSGLTPGTTYKVRLVALKPFGAGTAFSEPPAEFVAGLALPPAAITGYVAPRGATTARLNGAVNPNNKPTEVHFEYGTAGDCASNPCTSTPLQNVGSAYILPGFPYLAVSAELEELEPGTTYHYRLVATNSAGTEAGLDRTFTTRPIPSEPACSNADVRANQRSSYLPDCRGFELINAPDKGVQNVFIEPSLPVATPDGEAALWGVPGGAPGGTSAQGNHFLARRTGPTASAPNGWESRSLVPPLAQQLGEGAWAYAPIDATPDFSRFFFRANNANGGEAALVRLGPNQAQEPLRLYPSLSGVEPEHDALTGDGAHFLLINPGTNQLEDVGAGEPAVVLSIMPDGTESACGLQGAASFVGPTRTHWRPGYQMIDTASASRVYFQAKADNECGSSGRLGLYERNREATGGAGQTTLIDPGAGTHEPEFIRATPDGRHAYFTTFSDHTSYEAFVAGKTTEEIEHIGKIDSEEKDTNSGPDVYRWDEATGESVCLTCEVENEDGESLTGVSPVYHTNNAEGGRTSLDWVMVSDDFSHVYFESEKQLVPGRGRAGDVNLYALSGGVVRFVADPNSVNVLHSGPAELSTDGNVLVFPGSGLTADEVAPGKPEVYLYDDRDGSLECISCLHGGETTHSGQHAFLSSDGSTVAFATTEALVPRDVNNGLDLYEWRDGAVHLITDGVTEFASTPGAELLPVSISGDGANIFFTVVRPRLTGFEGDGLSNLYDARVGGGFEPPSPPAHCTEESCQGPLQAAPPANTRNSGTYRGPGNVEEPRPRCARGKVRRHGRCVKRRHHKNHHHRKHKRAARHSRRVHR